MVDKANAGDRLRIPATTWNTLVDVADAHKRQALGLPGDRSQSQIPTDVIKVQNICGATRSRAEILEIGDIVEASLDRNTLWFEGDTPDPAWSARYAVLLAPAANGAFAPAQVSGVCTATVNISNATHRTATVTANSYVLTSELNGPIPILYAPANTTGNTLCAVVIPPVLNYKPKVWFTLAANLAVNTSTVSGTITDQWGPGLDNPNTSAGDITLRNVDFFEGTNGAAGVASWDYDDTYVIDNLECP